MQLQRICFHVAILLSLLISQRLAIAAGQQRSASQSEGQLAIDFKQYGYDRLRRFAGAYMLVNELQRRHDEASSKLVPNSPAHQTLQAKTQAEMDAAIESVRLSPEGYRAIAEVVQKDTALRQQVASLVGELEQTIRADKPASDALDLGTLEVRGYTVTKTLMQAELEVAYKRSISSDPADKYLLICRKSTTASRIPRTWCAYNGELVAMQLDNNLTLPGRQEDNAILSIDPVMMSTRWYRFYNSLPD